MGAVGNVAAISAEKEGYISFFILDRSPCLHSMLIVWWWIYNPITESIGILESVPLMCLMHYIISPVFSSCPSSPTDPSLLLPSPLPCPLLLPPAPLHRLSISPPVPTIYEQSSPPTSAMSSFIGPESSASQCTALLCSASLRYKPLSHQIPPPPLLPPAVGIPVPLPSISLAISMLSVLQPRVGIFPGPVPCGGSAPMSLTQISAPSRPLR